MTKIVGILNLTPDSFSDGDLSLNLKSVPEKIEKMAAAGTSIIDIGAESTRPGATLLSAEEEWQRLHPLISDIAIKFSAHLTLSIDSRHHSTFQKCLDLGFKWLNDVSASYSANSLTIAKEYNAQLVLTHTLGVPANPQITFPENTDVEKAILSWAEEKHQELSKFGFDKNSIIFDPGIGFGKNTDQSFEIIKNTEKLAAAFPNLMIGHSRKSFLKKFTNEPAEKRDLETAIISAYLANKKARYLRVHNVASTALAIKISKALL